MGKAAVVPVVLAALAAAALAAPPAPPRAVVEVEEDVYRYEPANNGAGPMWCNGSTCIVRVGEDVYASGLETLKDFRPLNNCRWLLLHRKAHGWRTVRADQTGRTREPCPMAALPGGRVLLSVNPTLAKDPKAYGGPARPGVLQFEAKRPDTPPKAIRPVWRGEPAFSEHSYRSFAADAEAGEMILFQNIGYAHAEWAFFDREGNWSAAGQLKWPWGAEYDKPQPIRICYPTVALKDRAVHFCGVSDIVEPYGKWRQYKQKLTGRKWDYDFRRLFYALCPDIRTGRFSKWLEVASRDKTCGWIMPMDLWAGPDGAAHVLWTERAIDTRLRKEFFPGEKQRHALGYAVIRGGKVALRKTLAVAGEGLPGPVPRFGRFHVTPAGRLTVFHYVDGTDADGRRVSENRLIAVGPDGSVGRPVRVAMKHPMSRFFTATGRAGCRPSELLDLYGTRAGASRTLSYARIRIQ